MHVAMATDSVGGVLDWPGFPSDEIDGGDGALVHSPPQHGSAPPSLLPPPPASRLDSIVVRFGDLSHEESSHAHKGSSVALPAPAMARQSSLPAADSHRVMHTATLLRQVSNDFKAGTLTQEERGTPLGTHSDVSEVGAARSSPGCPRRTPEGRHLAWSHA